MAIIVTLRTHDFVERFRKIRPDDFSIPALRALCGWYEQYSASIGEDIEFDAIAICCEWSEYSSIEEVRADYDWAEDIDDFNGAIAILEFEGIDVILVNEWKIMNEIPADIGVPSCLKTSLLIRKH